MEPTVSDQPESAPPPPKPQTPPPSPLQKDSDRASRPGFRSPPNAKTKAQKSKKR